MREIKFRAWYQNESYPNKEPVMKYQENSESFAILPTNIYEDGDNSQEVYEGDWPEGGRITEFVELMQYTGLKDKNGVEIYEGDIVKTTNSKSMWIVDYVAPKFIVRIDDGGISAELYADLEHEVIGNTYENPELLEAKS